MHLTNYHKYDLSDQKEPSADELKFYNKILKVHSSHKQIRTIQNQNRIKKLRTFLFENKNDVETMFLDYDRKMNTQLKIIGLLYIGFGHIIVMKNECEHYLVQSLSYWRFVGQLCNYLIYAVMYRYITVK
ncbi:Hypothetical_protein [Hexamita inflata]|uniref:Hypothetical_protein n=1 Tax=Hexamita inflata TaxID=28002 RepID=A0AA86PBF3_9EUKA|nr:Hypothetical protein HINF_LOCUS23331 [Hexamita inflata]